MAYAGLYDAVFQQVIAVCQNGKYSNYRLHHHSCHDSTILHCTALTVTAVVPSIVDSVRDLRKINSNLLSDLQQAFCETVNQNILLVDENIRTKAENSQLHLDISKLQPVLEKLNDVSPFMTI